MPRYGAETAEEKRRRWVKEAILYAGDAGVLFPAVFYWSSYLMRWALGTDYWYDLIIKPWVKSGAGSLGMTLLTIILPAGAATINYLVLRRKHWEGTKWVIGIASLLMISGVAVAEKLVN